MTSRKQSIIDNATLAAVLEDVNRPPLEHRTGGGAREVTAEGLRCAIDAVFWAGQTEEEGKPVFARVAFADVPKGGCQFEEPVELSGKELRKLSPLMDGMNDAVFCVDGASILGCSPVTPHGIKVTYTKRHTTLVGDLHGNTSACFGDGIWDMLQWSSNAFQSILGEMLDELYTQPVNAVQSTHNMFRAGSIVDIVKKLCYHRRGGMIVLQKNGARRNLQSGTVISSLPLTYSYAPNPNNSPVEEYMVSLRDKHYREKTRALVSAAAGIDGATVVNIDDFTVRGFGFKVIAESFVDGEMVSVRDLPSTDFKDVSPTKLGGMRHQSAARLVREHNDTIVVTISQDGQVALFIAGRNDGRVMATRGLEKYFLLA
jgi:hypothetical protein